MKFCGKCGEIVDLAKIRSREAKGFELSQGEVEVRTYHCTTSDEHKGDGYVTVTNKRVIYHGHGATSFMYNEVHLNKITGLKSYFGKGYNKKQIPYVIALVLIGLFLILGFYEYKMGIGALIIAASILMSSREASYHFAVCAQGSKSAVQIGFMQNTNRLTGQGAKLSIRARATNESRKMMSELGAIILDFQSIGDQALKKWVPEEEIDKKVEFKELER